MLAMNSKRSMAVKPFSGRKLLSSLFSKSAQLTLRRFFCLIFIILLAACGTVPLEQPSSSATPTSAPTSMSIPPAITFTPIVPITPIPTIAPLMPIFTFAPTPEVEPMPISTSTETFQLNNIRMAYIVKGNLYVQNGNNLPRQLSNSGEDHSPIFSTDGEKIAFHRGKTDNNDSIFSINADGSDEQKIIANDWLTTLGKGTKTGQLVFVPTTHQMLFNTDVCHGGLVLLSDCTVGLFSVDTDTGKITQLMPPALGGDFFGYGNFSISPDGKMMSVAHAGQIDLLTVDGKVIHHSIMKYTPSTPIELYPRVFWLFDSSGLIVALPAEAAYGGYPYSGDPAYTVWRYTFDGNVATQIPLNPTPTWVHADCNDVMSASPNGNWVIYFTKDYQVYMANLLDGSTQLYLPRMGCSQAIWSSDNSHFIYGGLGGPPVLGSIDAPPASIPSYFVGWIDARRYIYFPNTVPTTVNIQIPVGEIGGKTLTIYKSNVSILATDPYTDAATFVWLSGK
jgi:WD40-like Beta Propeller Repeat